MDSRRKEKIEEIITMYLHSEFPEEMDKEVNDWLLNDLSVTDRNEILWYIWNEITPPRESDEDQVLASLKRKLGMEVRQRRIPNRRFILRVAAVLVPILFVSVFTLFLFRSSPLEDSGQAETARTVIQADEELKKYAVLTDGTELWLNNGSQLAYTSERMTQLEGEAYFEVAKREGQRFVVETDELTVTVTGTSFNVNSYPESDHIIISLYEGGLLVENSDTLIRLISGHELVYKRKSSEFLVYGISRSKPDWLRNIINFEEASTGEILQALEKIYGYKIDYGDFTEWDEELSLKFEGDIGLEETLFIMSHVSGKFTYTIGKDTVFLQKAPV